MSSQPAITHDLRAMNAPQRTGSGDASNDFTSALVM